MKKLKAYCHSMESISSGDGPIKCCEVSIQASADTLRDIAGFLLRCADKFDAEHADKYEHFHLRDEWKDWDEQSADIIVFMSSVDEV
ncbi:hypothetical protein ABHF91_12570 [Pseudaeromonas sp. ZJS20]|uniref:Imm32 family immunity protein n=1 Tax=Pseudaeromonas aegiceratis TaxID=3153928 RepID=UPI00390C6312